MTAIIGFRLDDRVLIYTDGAAYDDDGVFRQRSNKTRLFQHMPAVVAKRGSGLAGDFYGIYAANRTDFDDLVDGMAEDMKSASEVALALKHEPVNLSIVAGGFSHRTGRFEIVQMFYCLDRRKRPYEGSLTINRVDSFYNEPDLTQEEILPALNNNRNEFCDGFVIDAMEAMRAKRYLLHAPPAKETGCIIGGFVQKTHVSKAGTYTEIIHTWPDEIGQKLGETPAANP